MPPIEMLDGRFQSEASILGLSRRDFQLVLSFACIATSHNPHVRIILPKLGGTDGVLDEVIVNLHATVAQIGLQILPLVQGVRDGRAKFGAGQDGTLGKPYNCVVQAAVDHPAFARRGPLRAGRVRHRIREGAPRSARGGRSGAGSKQPLFGVSESAGINRLGTENERALRRKPSQQLWPQALRRER